MTTRAAANLYRAQHELEWEGVPLAVFNPSGKPVDELPVIYGFNNSPAVTSATFVHGFLIAEDGTGLGGHACSHQAYMPSDLGCLEGSAPDRHEGFRAHYPDGYRMVFIPFDQVKDHAGLDAAYQKNQAKAEAEGGA